MTTPIRTHTRAGLLIAMILTCAAGAVAQPTDRPGPPDRDRPPHARRDADGPRDAAPESPQQLRERINRRLELIRGEEARLERALQQLEAGEPADRVYASLRDDRPRGDRPDGPPRGGDPKGGPDGPPPEQFSPEMAPRVMRFLEENNPELFRRLTEARDRNPEKFDDILRERWPRIREMIRKDGPRPDDHADHASAMRAMDREVRDLAKAAAKAEGDDKAARTAELRAAIDRQFELHAENARAEIALLQERIDGLIKRLDHATANRAAMIDERIADLMQPRLEAPKELPKPLDGDQ